MPNDSKQTPNRAPNGDFLPGHTEGVRFKPGQSGNPKGRPPGLSIKRLLREYLADNDGEQANAVVRRLVAEATAGNTKAIEIILERIHGKETTHLDHTTKGEAIKPYAVVSPDDWDGNSGSVGTGGVPSAPVDADKSTDGEIAPE